MDSGRRQPKPPTDQRVWASKQEDKGMSAINPMNKDNAIHKFIPVVTSNAAPPWLSDWNRHPQLNIFKLFHNTRFGRHRWCDRLVPNDPHSVCMPLFLIVPNDSQLLPITVGELAIGNPELV